MNLRSYLSSIFYSKYAVKNESWKFNEIITLPFIINERIIAKHPTNKNCKIDLAPW